MPNVRLSLRGLTGCVNTPLFKIMTSKETLEYFANTAAILTLLGGVGAWCYYQAGFILKKRELEKFLKEEGESDQKKGKQGAYSFLHITAKTGLTESEILQASFRNPRIKRLEKLDREGFADKILFMYVP